MKSLNFSWLAVLAFMIVMVGCQKEEVVNTDGIVSVDLVSDYSLDNIPIKANTQDIQLLMEDQNDRDGEKLNHYLYELGLATRDLTKDAAFNQTIINMAKESERQTAYLLELKERAPDYYNKINERLAKRSLSLESIAADMTHAPILPNPEFPETAEIEKYVPAIFIPNLEQIKEDKQPLISPNIETDCSRDASIEDFIITWYFTEAGKLEEIILGEETAMNTSNPLFLMDHAVKFQEKEVVLTAQDDPRDEQTDPSRAISHFDSREIKIKSGYRQETGLGNNSEYAIVGYRIQSNGVHHWVYNSSGWKKIAEVKVNQINSTLVYPTLHAHNWTPYSQNRFFWNTFERDWNRSLKPLGSPSYAGTTLFMAGNMRYSGDWYAWIPGTINDHATPFEWFGWESSVNFASWKADYVVHRVF